MNERAKRMLESAQILIKMALDGEDDTAGIIADAMQDLSEALKEIEN